MKSVLEPVSYEAAEPSIVLPCGHWRLATGETARSGLRHEDHQVVELCLNIAQSLATKLTECALKIVLVIAYAAIAL